jgi:hypothetical protein
MLPRMSPNPFFPYLISQIEHGGSTAPSAEVLG